VPTLPISKRRNVPTRKENGKLNLNEFEPDANLQIASFLLHRHVTIQQQSKERINLIAAKDIYDSRFDSFQFTKIN